MEEVWPTPKTALDSIRFAATKTGESLEEVLRATGFYKRNHDKKVSLLSELTDCAMMHITALGPAHIYPDAVTERQLRLAASPYLAEHVFHVSGMALDSIVSDLEYGSQVWIRGAWRHHCEDAVVLIALHPGMDLEVELRQKMKTLKKKWLGVDEDAAAEPVSSGAAQEPLFV